MKLKLNIQHVRPSGLELIEKVVSIQRVTKVTKGGRTFSFSAIVVVGDQNGVVGYGLGKGKEVTLAITKATDNAKKKLVRIPLVNGTITHEQYGKYGGAKVFIRPASSGTGVIAGGSMRSIIEAVGIKDILAKSKGSTNPHNLVKATIEALVNLRDVNQVASARGISVNKVFNG
ncbi:MAG: 30S ribosomal protein S5 [Flavobacteriales bacterium]|nr:30S ribosomal protein S5 [Flavobacteriales bacterium]|tara:strand:+ start:22553 stop:23074 length:522 start_codon:yes stop_codon:yes gene_type:complete